jgi:hypothetical protein
VLSYTSIYEKTRARITENNNTHNSKHRAACAFFSWCVVGAVARSNSFYILLVKSAFSTEGSAIVLPFFMRICRFVLLALVPTYSFCGSLPAKEFSTMMPRSNLKIIRRDGIGGRGITLIPSDGKYSNVVIWMHGLGDTADGWAQSMPSLNVPNTKFILPTANSIPISINMGHSMPGTLRWQF